MTQLISQGVHTVYYGPTNTKAAQAFFEAKGWKGSFVTGGDADSTGCYHVQSNEKVP